MKPNFALSLSFEGIGLLHRAFPGWNRVGEVALDSPDLSGALEVLRETAQQINGQDLASKLVIPNEQIKFLSLELGLVDETERDEAILKALIGTTPYPVEQLAYDWSVDGEKTQVAAVARETLAEAEKFATEHGFGPVCFVAIPPAEQFSGEPFFGPTAYAKALFGDEVEVQRDMAPIRVTGVVRLPDPGDEEIEDIEAYETETTVAGADSTRSEDAIEETRPAPKPVQTDAANEELAADPARDVAIVSQTQALDETEPEEEQGALGVSVLSDTLPSVDDDAEPEQDDAAPRKQDEAASSSIEHESRGNSVEMDDEVDATDAVKADAPAFSTIRAQRDDDLEYVAPSLSGVRRNLESLAVPVAAPAVESESDTAAPAIESTPSSYSAEDDDIETMASDFGMTRGQLPPDEDVSEPETVGKTREGRLSFFSRRGTELASGLSGSVRNTLANRSVRRTEAKAEQAAFSNDATLEKTDLESERERMTVFGARKMDAEKQVVGGKPRYLGLVLTAILLVFLAGVAAWASLFLDDGLARFFGPRDTEVTTLAPGAADEMIAEGEEAMVPEAPGDATETVALAPVPEPTTPAPLAQPDLPHALTEKEAQARYAVTGVWQRAPQEPQLPEQLSLDDLYLTSIDPRVDAQDAVALPEIDALTTDLAMGRVALPAKRGTRFELDDRGLVVARVEGALSPEGFLVFAGRPPTTPPAPPERAETDEPAVSAEKERLSTIRPRARPDELITQNERANLGGLTRNELASKRPKLRPASAQQQAEVLKQQQEAEANAKAAVEDALAEAAAATPFDSATAQAVAQSRKPKPRPRNFARVVDRVRKAQETAEEEDVTKVAAAVPRQQKTAPSVPSKSSVAKAATVRNQLNLRKINLIGVYGKPNSRRALVRMSNGRYKKVKVGDRIDGGRVSSIGDGELLYRKNGRNVILKMPRG